MAGHIPTSDSSYDPGIPRAYAWIVFALTFGLLVSDYMSRQVLNAVFPLLKEEWHLSDEQLGSLSGVVALMVGLLTVPLSLIADKWGRVRSLTVMAILWSIATLACGLARNFEEMFAARFLVGVGEAAYGSVGIAVVISVFPSSMRATLASAFMAGGMLGSVLGVWSGGMVAGAYGWRAAFFAMAAFGLFLALLYPIIVRTSKMVPRAVLGGSAPEAVGKERRSRPLLSLVSSPSVVLTYVGSGLQLFIGAALMSWLPSFLNRYHAMPVDRAASAAAAFILCAGIGMVACGVISDRLSRKDPRRAASFAVFICITTFVLLSAGFRLPPGPGQLALIAAGLFLTSGTAGPSSAMVANLTHMAVHGSAFAVLTLVNNFLGLAPGPYITGILADRYGLDSALSLICLVSLASTLVFMLVRMLYAGDLSKASEFSGVAVRIPA
ncbi:MAG: multidrug DMT transporter permease [Hyphomonadaceae bacterium BRH_c29]|nr:MAG: multidrug DMT transporter permease [Hyphomonadaceae bacterium BRH_c29]